MKHPTMTREQMARELVTVIRNAGELETKAAERVALAVLERLEVSAREGVRFLEVTGSDGTDPDEMAVGVAARLLLAGRKATIKLAGNIMGETIAIEVWSGKVRVVSFDCQPIKGWDMTTELNRAAQAAAAREGRDGR